MNFPLKSICFLPEFKTRDEKREELRSTVISKLIVYVFIYRCLYAAVGMEK